MSYIRPVLFGCRGAELDADEASFFRRVQPFGFILFQRNCVDPDQLVRLTRDLRACLGRDDAPIFIDQEGGRVARLKPPHWPALPAMRRIGALFEQDNAAGLEAARLHAFLTAAMLRSVGIDGNCAPVLDLFVPSASIAIGDRVFSADPAAVAALGRVVVDTYLAHGIMPVVKHMPGHGRVMVDPHEELPYVDADLQTLQDKDFAPFRALADAPVAMNCHVVFKALDAMAPVSMSRLVHDRILRGEIGYKGLIFSDDLAMGALKGPPSARAMQALAAGADVVLYCPAEWNDMQQIADLLPPMTDLAMDRWAQGCARRITAPIDTGTLVQARARFDDLMKRIGDQS